MSAGSANIHASCVRLGRAGLAFGAPPGAGILLLGASGTGKSDLTLRLIAAGAELVADDRTELSVKTGRLIARAPRNIAGLVEVRGVGIVEIPYTEQVDVALAIALVDKVVRLPPRDHFAPPEELGLPASAHPPLVRIVAHESAAPQKIAIAAAAYAHSLFRDVVKPT
jgi:HPr kinase/phosphorylase